MRRRGEKEKGQVGKWVQIGKPKRGKGVKEKRMENKREKGIGEGKNAERAKGEKGARGIETKREREKKRKGEKQ